MAIQHEIFITEFFIYMYNLHPRYFRVLNDNIDYRESVRKLDDEKLTTLMKSDTDTLITLFCNWRSKHDTNPPSNLTPVPKGLVNEYKEELENNALTNETDKELNKFREKFSIRVNNGSFPKYNKVLLYNRDFFKKMFESPSQWDKLAMLSDDELYYQTTAGVKDPDDQKPFVISHSAKIWINELKEQQKKQQKQLKQITDIEKNTQDGLNYKFSKLQHEETLKPYLKSHEMDFVSKLIHFYGVVTVNFEYSTNIRNPSTNPLYSCIPEVRGVSSFATLQELKMIAFNTCRISRPTLEGVFKEWNELKQFEFTIDDREITGEPVFIIEKMVRNDKKNAYGDVLHYGEVTVYVDYSHYHITHKLPHLLNTERNKIQGTTQPTQKLDSRSDLGSFRNQRKN